VHSLLAWCQQDGEERRGEEQRQRQHGRTRDSGADRKGEAERGKGEETTAHGAKRREDRRET
jgi:hypothetical protein